MDVIAQLYDCSKRLYEHLQAGMPKKDREPYIKQIETLLAQRETLLGQWPQVMTPEDKQMREAILQYDRLLRDRLALVLESARADVGSIRQQKGMMARYTTSYPHTSADGMFVDERK